MGPIRLLKLDIEGHEPEFLRGAERWLRAHPPDAILFELNGALFGSGAASFWEEPVVRSLADLGYQLAEIGESLGAVTPRLRAVPAGGTSRSLDFVAIHSTCSTSLRSALRIC